MRYVVVLCAILLGACTGSPLQPDPITDAASPLATQDRRQSFGGKPISAFLHGSHEVEAPGADGSGHISMSFKPGQNEVCYILTLMDIGTPTAASIHMAPAGQVGAAVLVLPTLTGTRSMACFTDAREVVEAIFRTPEDYYVNVFTAAYPLGAIRGQLSK